jgi:protease-4
MAIDTDLLVDRRRLKRNLTAWRVLAVVLLVAGGLAIAGRLAGLRSADHVARVFISGVIVGDRDRDEVLDEILKDRHARALIVNIDSPGGTVVGGEALYNRLREIGRQKPVVAVMGDTATSAAYMTALGCERIFAHSGSVTGSIGVILQTANLTDLLDRIGIRPETIKSTPLKAQPNPLETFTPEAREVTRRVIADIYAMFVGLVKDRRGLSPEQMQTVADGRVFTGRQALANGLVDELGGESEARAWLASARGIDKAIPTRTVEIEKPERKVLDWVGGAFGKMLMPERLRLDGVVSLWHPEQ